MLQILTRTQVAPELAGELLADNAHLVLAYLGAAHAPESDAALAFLRQTSGLELKMDAEAWGRWIERLAR